MSQSAPNLALVPVILSGGSGTRLWPMSRQLYPKQFIPLTGDLSLFQTTLRRLEGIDNLAFTLVVCNNEHRFMAAEQVRTIDAHDVRLMLEPVGRNTAPAIAAAALEICAQVEDAVMLVLPADHIIKDTASFGAALTTARRAAADGHLVTFGIIPERAETGYGYIHRGAALAGHDKGGAAYTVDAFREKPDQATAESYLAAGDYFWNSGMFCFAARRYLDELRTHAPQIFEACVKAHEARARDLDFIRLDRSAFEASPRDSIDYAVMEKTESAVVIPLKAGWSDVGSWHSLWEAEPHDGNGNIEVGDILTEDCTGCYINAGHRLVSAVGIKDQIIIETADAVLVVPRARAQDTKHIVEQLKSRGRTEATTHRKVYRPWGDYEGIDLSGRFQVKRITVNPGGTLSLQMHHHRAEHWVVVTGTARVTRGDEVFLLSENESTFIPTGTRHRLENPGKIPLELIEVQSGSYLGEDDIVRFEDNYGR
ncbi:MAG: mannose-1-phosphate guanylyltransferase/mannose-6-phosphate isomerase [Gammaproteobacteria bacterium]|nr:mannose-1-phosphate guanylyltransferase/mannose-6-phosphate isomerase [Gammaproteobacteria bacterium]